LESFKGFCREQLPRRTPLGNIPFVKWGGSIRDGQNEITLLNTCSIDAGLQVLAFLFNVNVKARMFIEKNLSENKGKNWYIKRSLDALMERDSSGCKKIWIENVMQLDLKNNMDVYGTEENNFLEHIGFFVPLKKVRACTHSVCRLYNPEGSKNLSGVEIVDVLSIRGSTVTAALKLLNEKTLMPHCRECLEPCTESFSFIGAKPDLLFLCIHGMMRYNEKLQVIAEETSLKSVISVQGTEYTLMAYTMFTGHHFYCVLCSENKKIRGDGLKGNFVSHKNTKGHSVSSVWYIKQSK